MAKFTLPNGVKYEEKLYDIAYLEEMCGKQQNYLINTKYKSPLDHIPPLMGDLLVRLETEEGEELKMSSEEILKSHLQVEDLQFLLVKLREITFDEQYIIEGKECPHCQKKQDLVVNLAELEIIQPSQEKISMTVELPKAGVEAEYKPLTFGDLRKYAVDPDRLMNKASTSTAVMVLKRIGEDSDITEEKVEALKAKDIKVIQDNAPEYPHLDSKIEHTCKHCGEDFDFELESMVADFLLR